MGRSYPSPRNRLQEECHPLEVIQAIQRLLGALVSGQALPVESLQLAGIQATQHPLEGSVYGLVLPVEFRRLGVIPVIQHLQGGLESGQARRGEPRRLEVTQVIPHLLTRSGPPPAIPRIQSHPAAHPLGSGPRPVTRLIQLLQAVPQGNPLTLSPPAARHQKSGRPQDRLKYQVILSQEVDTSSVTIQRTATSLSQSGALPVNHPWAASRRT